MDIVAEQLDVTGTRLERAGTIGLVGIAVGAAVFAAGNACVDLGWLSDDGAVVAAAGAVLAVGMLVFGGLSISAVRTGRSLDSSARLVLGDELAVVTYRQVAASAFKATIVFVSAIAALSALVDLSGSTVAFAILGFATASLAVERIRHGVW